MQPKPNFFPFLIQPTHTHTPLNIYCRTYICHNDWVLNQHFQHIQREKGEVESKARRSWRGERCVHLYMQLNGRDAAAWHVCLQQLHSRCLGLLLRSWRWRFSLRQIRRGGSQGPVALNITFHTPTGRGRDLTFLTALQVSGYIRICTNSHDMYMTRSGCWLIDEWMGTGDVGEDKPRKTVFLAFYLQGKISNPLKCCHKTTWPKFTQYIKVWCPNSGINISCMLYEDRLSSGAIN